MLAGKQDILGDRKNIQNHSITFHAVSQPHHVSLSYMCFIFSSLLLPAEKLHYHQVVFFKGNLMVAVDSLPPQRPSCQVQGLQPSVTSLLP